MELDHIPAQFRLGRMLTGGGQLLQAGEFGNSESGELFDSSGTGRDHGRPPWHTWVRRRHAEQVDSVVR